MKFNRFIICFIALTVLLLSSCGLEEKTNLTTGDASRTSQILNGVETSSYPSVVKFLTTYSGGGFSVGSGVLIRQDMVLTAAHVVASYTSATKVQALVNGVTQDFAIASATLHPNYKPGSNSESVDLAVVKLTAPVPVTPSSLLDQSLSVGSSLKLVGYGRNGDPNLPNEGLNIKRVASAQVAGYEQIIGQSSSGYLLVSAKEGQGMACAGDSGGPALSSSGQVAGIFSLYVYYTGTGKTDCASTFKNYYVSVAAFKSWIDSTLGSSSSTTTSTTTKTKPRRWRF